VRIYDICFWVSRYSYQYFFEICFHYRFCIRKASSSYPFTVRSFLSCIYVGISNIQLELNAWVVSKPDKSTNPLSWICGHIRSLCSISPSRHDWGCLYRRLEESWCWSH
jgi:hypothetical protein